MKFGGICTDKTGTLTAIRMTARALYLGGSNGGIKIQLLECLWYVGAVPLTHVFGYYGSGCGCTGGVFSRHVGSGPALVSLNKIHRLHNLLWNLDACETMGCATIICTYKNETLIAICMAPRALYLDRGSNGGVRCSCSNAKYISSL